MLQPPLVQAIFNRNAEEVQLLLHKKEDVNALVCMSCISEPDRTGYVVGGLVISVRSCVLCTFILQDQERRTPLHAAACVGDVHIMDILIESGEPAACLTDASVCL